MPDPTIPRSEVSPSHTWNLTVLYPNDELWEEGLKKLETLQTMLSTFEGRLGESPEILLEYLDLSTEGEILCERILHYSYLRLSEDLGNSESQTRQARCMQVIAKLESAVSFAQPEIQAIPSEKILAWIKWPDFANYRISLEKLLRYKPHILSSKEEKLLAMQIESNMTAQKAFSALLNVDINFGTVSTPEGEKPLTNSTFGSFLQSTNRQIRSDAYNTYYLQMTGHENTLANLYSGSINLDIYHARVRSYPSSLEAALFPDKVDVSVYTNLVKTINEGLPKLHAYYAFRKKHLKLSDYSIIDTYAPLVDDVHMNHSYEEAVDLVIASLAPLGGEYCDTLAKGLLSEESAWVDRYENKGKRSGAFSSGSYSAHPHILMNYKDDLLRDLFTLAHEAGHAMHSWYSAKNNPFPQYQYTIFEAEVASTFNEGLLSHYLMKNEDDTSTLAYLVSNQINDFIATVFRQTMFAEFELRCHQIVEEGDALSVQRFKDEYAELQKRYFGPDVIRPEQACLEGLRIPHFYNAFYVYKYATGLSASIALSKRVLEGGKAEVDDYFRFLKSGGSKFPIESLDLAGVDMSSPEPIQDAIQYFADLCGKLESLLG